MGSSRLELLTIRLSGVHSNRLSYEPLDMLGKIRTLNPHIRSVVLYPIELQARRPREHTRADAGIRTLDPSLGKAVLSH